MLPSQNHLQHSIMTEYYKRVAQRRLKVISFFVVILFLLILLFKLDCHSSVRNETYVSAINYDKINLLTFGNVERMIIVEQLEIFQYDLTRSLTREIDKIDCVFLKNAKPAYHLCPHDDIDDWLSSQVKKNFVWESEIQDLIRKFFDQNPEATFVDLGCNIGAHTLFAASINKNVQVLAVEPFPKNAIRIHKAAHLNQVQDRITLVMAAVSDKRGPVTFHEKKGSIAENRLVRKGKSSTEKSLTTNAIHFDDLAPLVRKKKAFLKMDIEGSECHAFANANKFFDTVDVQFILMEIGHTMNEGTCCFEGMLNVLNQRNYKPFKLPYSYEQIEHPLNYSQWREWNPTDIMFKKFY